MARRFQEIKRGVRKGELEFIPLRTFDINIKADRDSMQLYHENKWSFLTANGMLVMDGNCFIKRSPKSPFNVSLGRVWDMMPELFRKP